MQTSQRCIYQFKTQFHSLVFCTNTYIIKWKEIGKNKHYFLFISFMFFLTFSNPKKKKKGNGIKGIKEQNPLNHSGP